MTVIEVRKDIFQRYLCHAPLALAMERSIESEIYRGLPVVPPVLDLGCGEGLFAEMVFSGRFDTGVEPDRHEIEAARQRGRHRELIQTTGDRIPKPDGCYQTVLSNSVLEHIPELQPVLKEVYRLLRVGGRFYCTVPSNFFDRYTFGHTLMHGLGLRRLARRYRRFYNNFWKHFHYYPLEGWIDMFTTCGFEVQAAFTFNPRVSCLLYDMFTVLGLPAKIVKQLTGRWTLIPQMRALLMKPVAQILHHRIRTSGACLEGGLVFMALTKPVER